MKLFGVSVLRLDEATKGAIMLTEAQDLSYFGFFQRGTVKEMITFFSKTIAERTPAGTRQSVQKEEYYIHVFMRADGLCGTATCDAEYPPRVAFSLLTKLLEDFHASIGGWQTKKAGEPPLEATWAPAEALLEKYKDPAAGDSIMKIQKNLDETRDVLHNTIESVLQRGEKLEDLVERSGELSAQSKMFYKQAKRANSCCAVV